MKSEDPTRLVDSSVHSSEVESLGRMKGESLAQLVEVRQRFARSANLERDASAKNALSGYLPTARTCDVVDRITQTAITSRAGGAWAINGPYGSGKSSLALLLDAAFGPAKARRKLALELLESVPTTHQRVLTALKVQGTLRKGWHRGLVTARQEPLTLTVLRGLHNAVVQSFGDNPTTASFGAAPALRQALNDAAEAETDSRRAGPSPNALLEIASCLASSRPLLLIIDEFGKNLEMAASNPLSSATDPYLLQQLAEMGSGAGKPIFLLTLQHQSFEEHLLFADTPKRKEWGKVQGRFEEVAYVDSPAQSRALIGSVFKFKKPHAQALVEEWAQPISERMGALGISEMADTKLVAQCWPLHPVAAVVLTEFCRRYGQHDRTMFSFLTSEQIAAENGFLATTSLNGVKSLPSLGLDAIYDYFVGSTNLLPTSSAASSRWAEITTRLRDNFSLSPAQSKVAKAVAMLNLISSSGAYRASARMIELAEPNSTETLSQLQEADLVTYRSFGDEFRIWQGSEVKIDVLIDQARQMVNKLSPPEAFSEMPEPSPAVAARHSAERGCLRVFERRYVSCHEPVEPLNTSSPYDGLALLLIDGQELPTEFAKPKEAAKPVVVAVLIEASRRNLLDSAKEVIALQRVLSQPKVQADWVARLELSERLACAQADFEAASIAAFSSPKCLWFKINAKNSVELEAGQGSAVLSQVADSAYPQTPDVPNEMINRNLLTAQGTKARRMLIEAMLTSLQEPNLGFEGNGPEVAMYQAALQQTGLHDYAKSGESRPKPRIANKAAAMTKALQALNAKFEIAKKQKVNLSEINATLMAPPFGMKAGLVPIVVTAGLVAHKNAVAIYEHGTFKPKLTADVAERLVKNPAFFDIKHFANCGGGGGRTRN